MDRCEASSWNKFTKVKPGDTCDVISFNSPIATEHFALWNTGVGGRDCRDQQAGAYVCVCLIPGGTPTIERWQRHRDAAADAPAHGEQLHHVRQSQLGRLMRRHRLLERRCWQQVGDPVERGRGMIRLLDSTGKHVRLHCCHWRHADKPWQCHCQAHANAAWHGELLQEVQG